MTPSQQLAKQMMTPKTQINWDELKFKIQNDQTYYFRFTPDGNTDNQVFFQPYKMYKLSNSIYVNYPDGWNNVQKTLNGLWATGDAIAQNVYKSLKGKATYNVNIILCDRTGKPIETKTKIWSITSKGLWEELMAHYFDEDFIDNPATFFSMIRTGDKLDTKYQVEKFTGAKIDFSKFELAKLDLPLGFKKSDSKALPALMKLNNQFGLGLKFDSAPEIGDDDYEAEYLED